MKKTILSGLLVLSLMSFTASCDRDDDKERVISAEELPAAADLFVKEHFPDAAYRLIAKENRPEADGSLYDVKLTNNFEIDFDAEGKWVDIEGNHQAVPEVLIPEKINAYIAENYKGLYVTSIDNERTGVEVELSNRLELVFDLQGNFIGIDR